MEYEKEGNVKNDSQVCSLHSRMRGWGLLAGQWFGEVSPEFSFGRVQSVLVMGNSSGHIESG